MSSSFLDKDYLLRCSEKTLQTNEKGFFLQFSDHVAETAGSNWIKNVFGKLKTDRERLKIIYEHKTVRDVVEETLSHVQEIYRKKNAEVSQKRRQDAKKLLQAEQYAKALILSSQSVLRAPQIGENPKVDDGFTLAFAYWERASILMNLNKFSWALLDIQAALKEGLPDDLKAEAFCKMAACYRGMGEENRAKISFELATRIAGTDVGKIRLIKEIQSRAFKEDKDVDRRILPTVAGGKNPEYQSASSKVSVTQEPGKGRFITAKTELKTGDAVVVESPYVSCLLPDCFGSNCHHCYDKLVSPVGCPDCANIAFCKTECRDQAVATYHKYECHYLDLLIGSGMSILCHAALRMITQNTLKKTLEIYKNRSGERIFSLCSNDKLRPPEDFLQRTLMAAFLLRCLQKSGYFNDGEANEEVVPVEEEVCVGEMLLFYLQILQFNAHEIYETRHEPEHRFKSAKTVYIGVALYPTAALFNHDCYPGVTRHFVGKNIVITATRSISPGEMVAENYGPIFTRKSLTERQRSLSSRYWFQCQCHACKQDWPQYDKGLENVTQRVRCPNKKCSNFFTLPVSHQNTTCPRCNKKVSLTKHIELLKTVLKKYETAAELMNTEDPTKAISLLREAIDDFHRISSPPHRETHIAQEVLRACLADAGNVYGCLIKL